jgi:hypothetical protein
MITIRATTEADIPAINRIYNQASVRRFTLGLPFVSLGGSLQFFKSGGTRTSLVVYGPDGAVLGEASLTRREACAPCPCGVTGAYGGKGSAAPGRGSGIAERAAGPRG